MAEVTEIKRRWLAAVLHISLPQETGNGEENAPNPKQRATALRDRLARLGMPPELGAMLKEAILALQQGRNVDDLLDTLEARATTAERSAEARSEINTAMGTLRVAFRTALLRWRGARDRAHGAVRDLQGAFRKTLSGQPDFNAIEGELSKLDDVMASLDDRLDKVLEQAMAAGDSPRQIELKQSAFKITQDYLAFAEQHPYLRKLDGNQFAPTTVFADLTGELRGLADTLK